MMKLKICILFFFLSPLFLWAQVTNLEAPIIEDYEEIAIQRVKQLTQYMAKIADKNTSSYEAEIAIKYALDLFISDTSIMEVSSCHKTTTRPYFVKVYLNRLKLLKYDDVIIESGEFAFVRDLKLGEDGYYYGIISFVQRFEGYSGEVLKYADITEKHVEIVLKPYQKESIGSSEWYWELFLADVLVKRTDCI